MKKFLSMVMALAMTLTLVTVGASAKSFTDDSAVSYKEAVSLISGLGVVDGYTDGSFNPTATLTRGAAAKIICNLMLGPTTASALGVTSAPFKDVPVTNVFAGYIAYCSQEGIINGYGDGYFKPAATVTGYQFMKMLLGALGYDGSIEGFTGTNWTVNVAKLAITIGLDDGNDSFVGSKAMTREEAALYAFNTLFADEVKYPTAGTTIITPDGTKVVTGGSVAGTITNTKADDYRMDASAQDTVEQFVEGHFSSLSLYTGTVSATRATAAASYDTVTYDSDTNATGTLSLFKSNVGLDLFGHAVNVYTNGKTTEAKQVVYAVVDEATKAATYTATSTTTDFELLAKAAGFSVANSSYLTSGYSTYSNYSAGSIGTAPVLGAKYVLISNNDNQTVDTIVMVAQTVDVVSKVTTSTSSTTGVTTTTYTFESGLVVTNKSDSAAKLVTSDTLAADDVVILTSIGGATYNAAKATSVTGTYTGKNTPSSGNPTYIIDGTTYAAYVSGNASVTIPGGVSSVGYAANMSLNSSYVAYLDSTGTIVAVKGVSSSSNYVYVAKVAGISSTDSNGISSTTLSAVVYSSDGTAKVYKCANTTGIDDNTNGTGLGLTTSSKGLYQMTINSDGKAVFATPSGAGTLQDNVVTPTGYSNITGVSKLAEASNLADVYTNASSVVYFVNGNYGDTDFSVTPVIGTALLPNIASFAYMVAGHETATGTTSVLKAALVNGSYSSSVAANTVFYNGKYSLVSTNTNGTANYAVTYTIYKDGVENSITYNMDSSTYNSGAGIKTTPAFYTTGDKNLTTYAGSGTATGTTTSLYNGYLSTSGGDFQVGDATVVDLTPDTQTFTSLVETGKTVTVFVTYTTNSSGVNVADVIYVTSVATNSYNITNSVATVNGMTAAAATTAAYGDSVTVAFTGTATAAGTITLMNGTTTLGTVTVAAGATSASISFVMPAADVTLTASFNAA